MEHKIIFHDDYVEIRAWGKSSLQGFIAYSREVLASPEWKPGMNILTDLSELEEHDTSNISFDDSSKFAAFIVKNAALIGNGKSALITAKGEDSKTLETLYESLTQYYGVKVNQKIVKDRAEAIAWFKEE